MKVFKAKLKCHLYLLFKGMWNGECFFRGWDKNNKISIIAASTGSIWNGTIKLTKIFYNTTDYQL